MSNPETFAGVLVLKTSYKAKPGQLTDKVIANKYLIYKGLSLKKRPKLFQGPSDGDPNDQARDTENFNLLYNKMGKPYLKMEHGPAPSVSFTHWEDEIWMAMGPVDHGLGIDVAHSSEFPVDYPFHKVFSNQELTLVNSVTGLALDKAAALSWSVKEAVAKALGTGFRQLNFTDIELSQMEKGSEHWVGEAFVKKSHNRGQWTQRRKMVPFVSSYQSDKSISIALVKSID